MSVNAIKDSLSSIEFLPVQNYENITVLGFKTSNLNDFDFLTLKKGLRMGLVELNEENPGGVADTIKVENNAVTPLLILEGEVLIGAKQDRIANTSLLIPPHLETLIPVSCVEANRWEYQTNNFNDSTNYAPSNLRGARTETVNVSLKKEGAYKSNQGLVWDVINQTQNNLNVESSTNALKDVYTSKAETLNEYYESFPYTRKQNGSIILINNEVKGLELLYNNHLYKEFHERIIKSYIVDALQESKTSNPENEDYAYNLAEDFRDNISSSKYETFKSAGCGEDSRLDNTDSMGSALIYKNELIHAVFFNKLTPISI